MASSSSSSSSKRGRAPTMSTTRRLAAAAALAALAVLCSARPAAAFLGPAAPVGAPAAGLSYASKPEAIATATTTSAKARRQAPLQARRRGMGVETETEGDAEEREGASGSSRRTSRWQQRRVDRREMLAAGAGVASAGAWVLSAAGAATTMTAPPPAAAPSRSGKDASFLCDDAISHLRDPKTGKEIYLIGTAHISNASAQLVRTTIRSIRPQTVMLELDEGRVNRVRDAAPTTAAATTTTTTGAGAAAAPSQSQSPPPQPRQGKPGFMSMVLSELTRPGSSLRDRLVGVGAVVVGQVIAGLYKTLDKMGFVSGQEFLVAMEEAKAVGADILLGDRNVQVTLRRLSEALGQSDIVKIREVESPTRSPAAKELAARGITNVGNDPAQIAAAMEALKDRASIRALMAGLKEELPAVYQAMIAERDEYMANSLRACPSKTIVAVVGMGHMDGIERNLGYDILPCRLGLGGGGK